MNTKTLAALAAALFLATACGGGGAENTTTTEAATDAESTIPMSETIEVPHRVLVDGLEGGGQPWTTGLVGTQTELETLVPGATVDRDREVVFRFTLAESSTCPFDQMQRLEYSAPDLRLYPVVPLQGNPEVCTDDAMPHTIVVAVDRGDLPDGAFSLWVSEENPPSGVIDGVTFFAAGELDDPGESGIEALNAAGDLPVGETRIAHDVSTHCGLDRIFRPIDGRQWVLENGSDELDYVPVEWRSVMQGEQIDLVMERTEQDTIVVTAVGTDVEYRYVPAPDTEGCD